MLKNKKKTRIEADNGFWADKEILGRSLSKFCGPVDSEEGDILVVNSTETYLEAYEILRRRIVAEHIANGVFVFGADTVHIDATATVAPGAKLYGPCYIIGDTVIEEECEITSGSYIENADIGIATKITSSRIIDSTVGDGVTVGPFAFIRDGACIGNSCRIGDFVEIKKSTLEDGVKCAHLAYIGDAEVGARTNVGCGVVFVNYNGRIKQRTIVGRDVFIGSNVNLVAPLYVGDNAYIAAGSTVTKNLDDQSFCIARSREYIKENYRPFTGAGKK